jgi:antitoxin HicB
MLRYPIVLERDDNDTLLVSFPDIPEAHTFGENDTDALGRAKDALVTALEARIRDREPIPKPSAIARGMFAVAVPALVELKLGLYETMRAHRVGKTALANTLDVHMPQVDRLLDLRHHSRLDLLEAALGSLGYEVTVLVSPRARIQPSVPVRRTRVHGPSSSRRAAKVRRGRAGR